MMKLLLLATTFGGSLYRQLTKGTSMYRIVYPALLALFVQVVTAGTSNASTIDLNSTLDGSADVIVPFTGSLTSSSLNAARDPYQTF